MNRTVVIVEDEMDLAHLLTDILESVGYAVVLTTGSQAVARIDEVKPAAVVIDFTMPLLNGDEVIQRMRSAMTVPPPVLLVTGMPNVRELASTLGAAAYLRKPFDVDAFVDAVDKITASGLESAR